MDIHTRKKEIAAGFRSFQKKIYRRNEALEELLELQREMVDFTVEGSASEKENLRIDRVVDTLKEKNNTYGHCADEAISAFEADAQKFSNAIGAIISGNRGESKAFFELEQLHCPHRILKNVELTGKDFRTEIDAVVITPQAVFLIEVKNTKNDIKITEEGEYYVCGRNMRRDCNIAQKLTIKEKLLTEALQNAGISSVRIEPMLVFTDDRIQVENRCPDVHMTFLRLLCWKIEKYQEKDSLSADMAEKIEDAIENARSRESYPVKVDVQKMKEDFAWAAAVLENAEEQASRPEKAEPIIPERRKPSANQHRKRTPAYDRSFWQKVFPWGFAGAGAAAVAVSILVGVMKPNHF